MLIPRLLVVSLLIAASVVSAAAQAARDKSADSSSTSFIPPQRWADFCAKLQNYHCVFIKKANSPSQPAPNATQPKGHDFTAIPVPELSNTVLRLEPNDVTCYSMRTYRVTRDDPDSDATRPAGYSTCLPGTRVQLWTSEGSPAGAPR